MSKAILIDTTKCIGCRACQVACKSWNELPGEKATFSETWSNPKFLSSHQYNRIIFREISRPNGQVEWHFISRRCMHCNDPACASACPVAALTKLPDGPVVYDDGKCIGCRYCMMACPFQIPKFEWGSAVPLVRKCTQCADRQAMGLAPACVTTCPTGTLLFGERDKLLKEAHRRIGADSKRYYSQVYGEKIAGGTSTLYLTALPTEELGLTEVGFRTDLGDIPQGIYGREWMSKVPFVAVAVGGLAVGLHYLNRRRGEVHSEERKED
ncbi:MAG: 4Fe-4S dicluster domain-containing protein [Deltaproteobacteria bacterium]|nr:4Fe-4S dicluster domain-containing protein [Deltaproteobacteria bacterium]